jgi:hypothetical protein
MRSTIEEAERCTDASAGAMMAAMSHGALMGARGNSGVILSQILRGFARALDGVAKADSRALTDGLAEGSTAAYRAVTSPAEGTILTVAREVAEAVRARDDGAPSGIESFFQTAVDSARESVARTPTLLPVLAEAGVVDAGGQGLFVLLEGMLRHLHGEETAPEEAEAGAVEQEWLSVVEQRHQVEESPYGYCTEVLVEGRDIDIDELRETVIALGDSVLVVGDESLARIHVHTDDPGAVLQCGTIGGRVLTQVKVDNIKRQAERFVEMHAAAQPQGDVSPVTASDTMSCVAVASGDGLADVFRSVGCSQVVSGGPTMNPSTRDILDAIEACSTQDVVVLPNDKNIIMSAQQAAEMTEKRVRVVKSRSVPQGLAALLAVNPEHDLDENAEAMDEALPLVRTIEITHAVRSTSINGVRVQEGETIAIVDDKLTLSAATAEEAALGSLRDLVSAETSLITLYFGGGVREPVAAALAARLREELPGHEVEVVYGGQPHYQYIISLE